MKYKFLQIIILPFALLLYSQVADSQVPKGFNYQAVIRNSTGQPIANQSVKIQITITDQAGTTTHYKETHAQTTSPLGLVNLSIGNGTFVQGDFNTIPWQNSAVYIKIEVDPAGGTNWTSLGITQLKSVPYSLLSSSTESVATGIDGQTLRSNGTSWEASSLMFSDKSNSRIGVNTLTPSATLHINGTTRLGGLLYDNNNIAGSNGDVLTKTASGVVWQVPTGNIMGTGTAGNMALWSGTSTISSLPNLTFANSLSLTGVPTVNPDDPIFEVKNSAGKVVFGVYQGGVRINVDDAPAIKGSRGGFAVGGLTNSGKMTPQEYFRITPDSARIWVNETIAKGARGGFAVGGLTNKKVGNNDYFNVSPSTTPTIINDNAQLLWYPLKEAFLVGRVQVLDPADVGLNSFSTGYHSKAKGDYSQSMGTSSVASGSYSTAIGQSCLSSGSYSFAFGSNSQATNSYNVAIGNNSQATGSSNNYAFGTNALASGSSDNYAIGSNTKIIEGYNSYAIGSNAEIYPFIYNGSGSSGSYAIGNYALVKGQRAYAIGDHARALNNDAIAFGTNAKSSNYLAIAIGANGSTGDTTQATGQASISMGAASVSQGGSSITMGTRSLATSDYGIGIGYEAKSNAMGGISFGYQAVSNSAFSLSIGRNSLSSGSFSSALGNISTASADYASALGTNATASGNTSLAIGSAIASGDYSSAIGYGANAAGNYSLALGNSNTSASAANSVAIGSSVNTGTFTGSIAIGDGNSTTLTPAANNQFLVRAAGGYILYSNSAMNAGVSLASGGGSWSSVSDVRKKANFKDENPEDYLTKLSAINIQSWNYKSQSPSIRHIGITAQDFYRNFRFGESDTTITDIDLGGVNMVAIKGLIERDAKLNKKITEQNLKIESLEQQYAILKTQFEEIKNIVNKTLKK